MKKHIFLALMMVGSAGIQSSYALPQALGSFAAPASIELARLDTLSLIEWKVGESMQYDVTAGPFGKVGTMSKEVTADDGTILVVKTVMDIPGQRQDIETWINKDDGSVVKLIRNGKEEALPAADDMEVIDQSYESVTVPAGTFDSLKITAKTKEVSKIEIWVNPQATVMDGSIKTVLQTSMVPVTIELTSFIRL